MIELQLKGEGRPELPLKSERRVFRLEGECSLDLNLGHGTWEMQVADGDLQVEAKIDQYIEGPPLPSFSSAFF